MIFVVLLCSLCLSISGIFYWKSMEEKEKYFERNFPVKAQKNFHTFYLDEKTKTTTQQTNVEVVTTKPYFDRVVYNRVGKCGSRTMQDIIKKLSKKNKFNFHLSSINSDTRPKLQNLISEVKLIDSLPSPMLYSRHIHYINFLKFGVKHPIYINLIRDPIERFSSNYHFKRYGDMLKKGPRSNEINEENLNLDINDCILKNYSECMPGKLWYIVPYFCGQESFCRFPSKEALTRAKMNVLDEYIVVGILEDFIGTLKVFEKILPTHFNGASEIYAEMLESSNRKNTSTVGKKKLSPEAYKVLRSRMLYDYEFYKFVVDLFKFKKNQLNIK